MSLSYAVVIPTLGRPSLERCLRALADGAGPRARRIILVDDRPPRLGGSGLSTSIPRGLAGQTVVVTAGGGGPAAARNIGWRTADAEWIAFLDDDTVPGPTWAQDLVRDLAEADSGVAGVQGRITVPVPADRLPTDWERGTAALADSRWITADMAYRTAALREVDGFDERFRRAYREDADIALRMIEAGWSVKTGRRTTAHPVRPADFWVSVRAQAGNADDVLMRRLHGRRWRTRAGAPPGRLRRHLIVTGAALGCVVCAAARAKRPAAVAGAVWLAGVAEFAAARTRPGPRDPREVATMVVTSAVIPPAAAAHWLRGLVRHRAVQPWSEVRRASGNTGSEGGSGLKHLSWVTRGGMRDTRQSSGSEVPSPTGNTSAGPWVLLRENAERREYTPAAAADLPTAVLFDRDGTLVEDVPYNGDPDAVRLRPHAAEAVRTLRKRGIAVGVVTNQSGVGRGLLTRRQVQAVNRRIDELVGPLDVWAVCPHDPAEACGCRKPAPGLVLAACCALGVDPATAVVVGDIGADIAAAESAGAEGILVPNSATRPQEVAAANRRARDLEEAMRLVTRASGPGEG